MMSDMLQTVASLLIKRVDSINRIQDMRLGVLTCIESLSALQQALEASANLLLGPRAVQDNQQQINSVGCLLRQTGVLIDTHLRNNLVGMASSRRPNNPRIRIPELHRFTAQRDMDIEAQATFPRLGPGIRDRPGPNPFLPRDEDDLYSSWNMGARGGQSRGVWRSSPSSVLDYRATLALYFLEQNQKSLICDILGGVPFQEYFDDSKRRLTKTSWLGAPTGSDETLSGQPRRTGSQD